MHNQAKGARTLALAGVALLAFVMPAFAQTTGKIEGRVRDAASGQPLAGAQVSVVGTTLGNITNDDGYYFINNVPAGLQDVRAQFIGYQTVTVTDQRVLTGQTMTVNFELQPSAVEIAPIEVVGESNPLVPRDKTVSKAIVTGDVVQQLPVDNIREVVTLQPGVVDYGDFEGVVIRGGRPGEASVYVDGVLVRSFNRGAQSILDVGTNAIEEVNVLLGGYGAEYGQAQSGIINYVTKTGAQDFSGAVSFWSDEMMPNDVSFGENRLEASLSGPITENSSFHLSLTGQGAEDATPTFMDPGEIFFATELGGQNVTLPVQTQWFRPVAGRDAEGNVIHQPILDGDGNIIGHEFEPLDDLGNRTPWSNQDLYTLGATVRFSPFENTRLSLSTNRSRNQGLSFNEDFQFRPKAMPAFVNKSQFYRLGIEQILLQSAERQATLKVNVSWQQDDSRFGQRADTVALEPEGADFLGFRFSNYEFLFEDFTVDRYMARLDSIRAGSASDPLVPVEVLGLTAQQGQEDFDLNTISDNPYGKGAIWWGTGFTGYRYSLENTFAIDADLDFQLNRVHRLGAGVEFYKKHVENISSTGFGTISAYDTYFQNVYQGNPLIGAVYVKDRMDIGEMVIDAGLRFDFFDSDMAYPERPGLVYPYEPNGGQAGETVLEPTLEQDMIWTISPRLGVAFPISDATNFRLSYGHFFQIPQFTDLFNSVNTDISKTNTNTAYGRPIDPMKAVQFEAGLSHIFSSSTVLDLTAYNKDKLSDSAYRLGLVEWPNSRRGPQDGRVLTNLDFGNVRGVDVRLTRRLSEYFTAIGGYSLLSSRGTGSDPFAYINSFGRFADPITGAPLSPAQAMASTDFDQTHKFTLAATANLPADVADGTWNALLRNTDLALTVNSGSGFPYTRMSTPSTRARGTGSGGRFIEPLNSSRMPWQFNADAKVTRGFMLGGNEVAAFLDVRNVFNTRNTIDLYGSTSSPIDPGDVTVIAGSTLAGDQTLDEVTSASAKLQYERQQAMLERYGLADDNPDVLTNQEQRVLAGLGYLADETLFTNFSAPRRIRLGFEFIF